jgi:hypothetical protein
MDGRVRRSGRRPGTRPAAAAAALLGVLTVGAWRAAPLADRAQPVAARAGVAVGHARTADDPAGFLLDRLAEHPVVFLGDIHPYAEPKRILADALRRMTPANAVGLVALEVAAEQQPAVDRYLATSPEDTTILTDRPRTLRDHWGASHEYLGIYRAVWAWNDAHPAQPIRIAAIDLPRWPLFHHSEAMAASSYVDRDRAMATRFRRELQKTGAVRAIAFLGGLHGLRGVGGVVQIGRARESFPHWFAGYLESEGVPVYSILTDGPLGDGASATLTYDRLAPALAGRNVIVALDSASDADGEPVRGVALEGYELRFEPRAFHLRDAAQAMLVLTRPTPLTPIRPVPPAP